MPMKFFLLGPIVAATALVATAQGVAQETHGGHVMGTGMESGDAMGAGMGAGHDMGTHDMGTHDMGMQNDHAMGAPAGESAGGHAGHGAGAMQEMGNTAPRIHQLHIAGQQHVLAHTAMIQALLLVLDVDREENLEGLRQTRHMFQRMQTGLRHGDDAYGIVGFDNPEVLARLADVDRIWARYANLLDRTLERPHVRTTDVSALAAINPMLHEALDRMVVTVERQAKTHSILIPTVRQAGNLHIAMQEVLVNYLLAASRDDGSLADVRRSAEKFERLLQAMVQGNSELQVLAAPNSEIASRYARIDLIWGECWSEIQATARGDRASPEAIEMLQGHLDDIAADVVEVVARYHFL